MPPSPVPAIPLPSDKLPFATDAETAMMRAAFDKFDADGSGYINKSELRGVLDELGKDVSESELQQMMTIADKDGSGEVDFQEFGIMLGKQVTDDGGDESILTEVFKVFDRDGSGYIEKEEMYKIFQSLETNSFRTLNREQVDKLMSEADTDKDGKISYEEFVKMMLKQNDYESQ